MKSVYETKLRCFCNQTERNSGKINPVWKLWIRLRSKTGPVLRSLNFVASKLAETRPFLNLNSNFLFWTEIYLTCLPRGFLLLLCCLLFFVCLFVFVFFFFACLRFLFAGRNSFFGGLALVCSESAGVAASRVNLIHHGVIAFGVLSKQ